MRQPETRNFKPWCEIGLLEGRGFRACRVWGLAFGV